MKVMISGIESKNRSFQGAILVRGTALEHKAFSNSISAALPTMRRRISVTYKPTDNSGQVEILYATKKEATKLAKTQDKDAWIATKKPPTFDAMEIMKAVEEKAFDFVDLIMKKHGRQYEGK